jgi:hypothetical protein
MVDLPSFLTGTPIWQQRFSPQEGPGGLYYSHISAWGSLPTTRSLAVRLRVAGRPRGESPRIVPPKNAEVKGRTRTNKSKSNINETKNFIWEQGREVEQGSTPDLLLARKSMSLINRESK